MRKIDILKLLNNYEDKYYPSDIIINVFNSISEIPFDEVEEYLNNTKIFIEEEDIVNYLNQMLHDENPDLEKSVNLKIDSIKFPELASKRFELKLQMERYEFYPYTLYYYINHSNITREKCLKLFDIMKGIYCKDPNVDVNLRSLDIRLDDDKNILKSDIFRLMIPFFVNLEMFNEKIKEGNDVKTYLVNKLSLDKVYSRGASEDDLYPSNNLQMLKGYELSTDDYVPLTQFQKEQEDELVKDQMSVLSKMLFKN